MTHNPIANPQFPPGWNEPRVQQLLQHYEQQTEDEAVAEDEAALELEDQSVIVIPNELVETVRRLIADHKAS
jgi:hypothetical protein